MCKTNLEQEDLDAIKEFGETGILTSDALYALGELMESWETRIDDIWRQLPASETGGTNYANSYTITTSGIHAKSYDYRCGSYEEYEAYIPFRLFLDDDYADKLRIQREEETRKAEEARKARIAQEQRDKERRERNELKRLKEKYENE